MAGRSWPHGPQILGLCRKAGSHSIAYWALNGAVTHLCSFSTTGLMEGLGRKRTPSALEPGHSSTVLQRAGHLLRVPVPGWEQGVWQHAGLTPALGWT